MNLRLTELTKRYGAVTAVDHVTLELAASTTLALLGPSGCGKSTLLRLVAGLEAPDAGGVAIGDEDLTRTPTARRGFGMVFQDYALFPHLDVGANAAFGLVEARVPAPLRAARVKELLALVGLAGLERRKVNELSGGQQQRVALARALAPEPRLLLLDEPLSNLDSRLRESLKLELRGILSGLPAGAIYVTHDQGEAFTVADNVALMRQGRIVQVGTSEELLARPAGPWAARFLGHDNVYETAPNGAPLPAVDGALLLRADLTRLGVTGTGNTDVRVATAAREGLAWRLTLAAEAWGVNVIWRGFDRELPEHPAPGASFGLHVPPEAWRSIGSDA
ncbi:MAG TPA: ABC transporter ATP-binding protein [Trueperaceae bacterium]|nr:ABC transporter ATP-binding protein [Trueperaceae bacterium]